MTQISRLVFFGLAVFVVSSCGDATESGTKISGDLSEWKIAVDSSTVIAGDLTFRVRNSGTIDHEFVVVKTDIPAGAIPVQGGLFVEDQEGIDVIDEIPPFAKGGTEELAIALDAGLYQLVCNLPGHYQAGMHTTFIVK